MDFYDENGQALQQRNVKLGEPVMFKIDVAENKQVSKILPEHCYFSSSSDPTEKPVQGQTLTFVKHSCFNDKNGMIRAFLPKMQRAMTGATYEMLFPAFYFTDFGQSLFVHCTILACVGSQSLCDPKPSCFGMERRAKRGLMSDDDDETPVGLREDGIGSETSDRLAKELTLTKYIIVEDKRKARGADVQERTFYDGTVCMQTPQFAAAVGSFLCALMVLLVCVSCMGGRLVRLRQKREEKATSMLSQHLYRLPPAYSNANLPTITAF